MTSPLSAASASPHRPARSWTAPRLNDAELTRAVNDARIARLCSPAALADVLARNPTHPGSRRLTPFAQTTQRPTRSRFEDRFANLCERYGLPTPAFNVDVCGYMVDALFVPQRLIDELDSWEFHQDRHAFQYDRRRDADTLAAGYATVRITWDRSDDVVAANLRRILDARR